MWEPGPFPKPALKRVQNLEGNSNSSRPSRPSLPLSQSNLADTSYRPEPSITFRKNRQVNPSMNACMDCGKPETSWGGPTYGIVLCVTCAGRHRSLGTHLSVIKSLTMDHWDAAQVKRMELGGNEQLRAWFAKCKTENSALEMKYRTKASTLYRANLQAAAEEEVARLEAGGEERTRSGEGRRADRKGRVFAASEAAAARDLAREKAQAAVAALAKDKDRTSRRRRGAEGGSRAGDPLSAPTAAAPAAAVVPAVTDGGEVARRCGNEEYEVVFGAGGLGFTLMKDAVSRALVTRLAPGGSAFRLGVRTGDYLVGLDGNRLYDYDKLMLLLPRAPRPLRLLFEGAGAALAAPPPGNPASSLASGQLPPFSTLPSSSHKKKEQQQERRSGSRGIGADRVSSTGSDSDSSSSGSGSTGSTTTTSSGDTSGSETDATNANGSAAGDSDDARNGKARRTEEPLPPALEVPEKKKSASSAPETTAGVSPAAVAAAPSAIARSSGVVPKTAAPTGSRETPQEHGNSAALPQAGANGDGLVDGKRETVPGFLESKDRTNGGLAAGSKHLGHPAVDCGFRRGEGARAEAVAPASRATIKGEMDDGPRGEEAAKDGKSKGVATSAETETGRTEGAAVRVVGGVKPVKVEAKEDKAVLREAAPSGSGVRRGEGARTDAVAPASRAIMKGERDDGPRGEEEAKDGKSKDVDESAETKTGRIEGAAVRVVEEVKPVKVEAKEDKAVLREVAPRGSDEEETAAPLSSSTRSRTAAKAGRRARTAKEVGEHGIPAGEGHANGGGEAHSGRGTQDEEGDGKEEKGKAVVEKREEIAVASSSGRSSHAAVDHRDDSSLFTQGTKVLVRDRKGSAKLRKGLLRRRHGDGTWTVRYSGGLEERRVPEERMRLRAAEEPAVEDAVADSASVKAPEEGKGHRLRQSRKGRKEGAAEDKERRHRGEVEANGSGSRNRGRGRGSAPAGAAEASASARTGVKEGVKGRSRGWVPVDGTEDRHEDFRAPGELRDDFFSSDHDAAAVESSNSDDSEDAVPGLYAYGRVEPPATAASWNPSAYSVAGKPAAYSAPYAAPRRMEGFGGGAMPVPNISVQQQQQQPWGRMVSFPEGSMGLTLTKELGGGCSVTNVVPGGTAYSRGVVVGQRVCAVNGQPTGTYEQTMAIISGSPRPVSITFLDPVGLTQRGGIMPGAGGGPPVQQQSWADVGIAATIGAMDAANAVAVEWGLGVPTTGVLDEVQRPGSIPMPPQGFRVHQKQSLMAIPTGVAGGFGKSLAAHRTFAVDVSPEAASMTTKKALADQPKVVSGEYDVTFGEGELGMRLEERGSFKACSVVIRVSKDGQAIELGVREGCTVVGINGEEYLSHAHTVATLKHAKRPVTVRFRAPESRR